MRKQYTKYLLLTYILFTPLMIAQSVDSLTFSEIMFQPSASNSEFIEIRNYSKTQTINLENYSIVYSNASPDLIVSYLDTTLLSPGEFAVVFEGDYDFEKGIYFYSVPAEALVLKINNNTFGNVGMANSSDRTLSLISNNQDTIQTYTYSADNAVGYSDEKVLTWTNDGLWKNSIILNGTPGEYNSVSPLTYDIKVMSFVDESSIHIAKEPIYVKAIIKNIGIEDIPTFDIYFYHDIDLNSIGSPDELIYSQSYENLNSSDSVSIESTFIPENAGEYSLICKIYSEYDLNPFNDSLLTKITVDQIPPKKYDLVINEAMIAPIDGEPEWIEIYNNSANSFNLKNFFIGDNKSIIRIDTNYIISPSSYLILADNLAFDDYYEIDSNIIYKNMPSFNNGGDQIRFLNSDSTAIDSLEYFSLWIQKKGASLERRSVDSSSTDSSNWAQSIHHATPGMLNSIAIRKYDAAITTFSPIRDVIFFGEQVNFKTVIKNVGQKDLSNLTLTIFNDKNFDNSIPDNEEIASINISRLNVSDSLSKLISINNYQPGINHFWALINSDDDLNSSNDTLQSSINVIELNEMPGDVLINEFMYAPLSDEGEWIELINSSSNPIDLKNYQIGDGSDTNLVIDRNLTLLPNSFFIIAKDSLFTSVYPEIDNVIYSKFPTLNNSGDKIFLLDSLNRTIDSVIYKSTWGGKNGKSLERISTSLPSADSSSWQECELEIGGTPNKTNTASKKDYDIKIISLNYFPVSPVIGENVTFSSSIENTGKQVAQFQLKLSIDRNLDFFSDELLETSEIITLQPNSTIDYKFNLRYENIQNTTGFEVTTEFNKDENLTDNSYYVEITPGYEKRAILINEIYYNAETSTPEWVELINHSDNPINLNGWLLSDVYSSPDTVLITDQSFIVSPNQFVVISKDSSVNKFYPEIGSALIVSQLPNLNNDEDGVVIYDANKNIIDSMYYGINFSAAKGYSLERVSLKRESTDSTNWLQCISTEKSTPNFPNSVREKNYDLTVSKIISDPINPNRGENIKIGAIIKNPGLISIGAFQVEIYSVEEDYNLIDKFNAGPIKSKDSLKIFSNSTIQISDSLNIMVKITLENDEDNSNNILWRKFYSGFKTGDILINEIMFDPIDGNSEWIEFYNNSDKSVKFANWTISDKSTAAIIDDSTTIISPGEYFLISREKLNIKAKTLIAKYGSLNNSEETITLKDFNGTIIDSIYYNTDYGGISGRSLERIDLLKETNLKENWCFSLSSNNSTPGSKNSTSNISSIKPKSIVINEVLFEPNSGLAEFVELFNNSNFSIKLGGAKIFIRDSYFNVCTNLNELAPHEYFVIASDSTIYSNFDRLNTSPNITIANKSSLGLSNEQDQIIIKDLYSNTIDSVYYFSNWQNKNLISTKNHSLERINPSIDGNDRQNWNSSVAQRGSTPGEQNSIFTKQLSSTNKITISPNPFSPDNDGFEDNTIISYNLSQSTAQIRAKIFDSQGRLVRTLFDNRLSGSNGSIIFDGLNDSGNALRIGIYILLLEAVNSTNGIVDVIKKPLVIARKFN